MAERILDLIRGGLPSVDAIRLMLRPPEHLRGQNGELLQRAGPIEAVSGRW